MIKFFQLKISFDKIIFIQLRASICLLRGKVAEILGSLQQAMKFYEEALRFDVFCAEAYEKLIKKHMYTPEEGINLLNHLIIRINF
jgi:hypothetical protein